MADSTSGVLGAEVNALPKNRAHGRGLVRGLRLGLASVGALVSGLLSGGCASGPTRAPLTAADRQVQLASFDRAWEIVRDRHYDPNLNGVDWTKVRATYRPKVEAAHDVETVRGAIQGMLEELHQSHYALIPAEAYDADKDAKKDGGAGESAAEDRSGDVGVTLRCVDGRAIVTRVRAGSPADQAGVKPGWVLARVQGKSVDEMTRKIGEAFKGSLEMTAMQSLVAERGLRGPVGESVSAEFVDGQDRTQRMTMVRTPAEGKRVAFGNFPAFNLVMDRRSLPGDVEYFGFNVFFDPAGVMSEFRQALTDARKGKGFVLDLRGNPGGIGAMAMGIGGWFVTASDLKLGTMKTRESSINFVLNPQAEPFEGPLAVLVDERSMSTSEILAGGLQDLKRARVFGTRTAGAALPSNAEVLPNGDRLQYVMANYISSGGLPLEARGVIPDEVVPPSRSALLAGRDPALDAALAWIHSASAAVGMPAAH